MRTSEKLNQGADNENKRKAREGNAVPLSVNQN
jgi:hypothetical protein